jgi:hypothetical protein
MKLPRFHDLDHKFYELVVLTWVIFWSIFLIIIFSISSFNIGLIGNHTLQSFSIFLCMKLSQSHDLSCKFCKLAVLTRVIFLSTFYFIFFNIIL